MRLYKRIVCVCVCVNIRIFNRSQRDESVYIRGEKRGVYVYDRPQKMAGMKKKWRSMRYRKSNLFSAQVGAEM